MRLFNKAIPVLLLSCMTLYSCVEEPVQVDEEVLSDDVSQKVPVMTRSSSDETYTILPNPYALEVMQEVYDIYSEPQVTLAATDLYVKFMPKDSVELHTLKYEYNLELFDYTLDIELASGEIYENPDLPENHLTWVYTTVDPDFVFPTGISYEILEECYIPADGETVGIPTRAGEVNVEDAAFALMGYDEAASVETRSVATPQGTIRVYDNDNSSYVPVKGVKVRCHRLVKWATAYTDENGTYTMNKSFRYKPHYAVVFDNIKDFDIWGNWGPIARANYNMGWQSNTGYSVNIGYNSYAWQWAVVNNAAYEYYQMCEQTGILKPPAALKIWVWNNVSGSSAPMLRRITDPIGYNGNSPWASFFINMCGYGLTATLLNQTLKIVLPDVTIGTLYSNNSRMGYEAIYDTVNHELAHSSHFSKVGSPFWSKYVSYIMTYGAYGDDDSGNNAQLCAIGEMWGYFMGHTQALEKFEPTSTDAPDTVETWIYPQVFWEIYSTNTLSKKQIFDCLTSEVDTYNELVARLYTLYPERAADIERVFNNYPSINHTVSLPGTDGIVYDAFCSNQSITSSTTISGENILVQNSTVSNGATLTLNAGTSITINKPFIVEKGSKLIMTRGN